MKISFHTTQPSVLSSGFLESLWFLSTGGILNESVCPSNYILLTRKHVRMCLTRFFSTRNKTFQVLCVDSQLNNGEEKEKNLPSFLFPMPCLPRPVFSLIGCSVALLPDSSGTRPAVDTFWTNSRLWPS